MAAMPPPVPGGLGPEGLPGPGVAYRGQQAPQTAVDFWDLGDGPAGQPLTQDYEFSEIVNVQPTGKSGSPAVLLLGVLLLAGFAATGWFVYTSEEDPLQLVMNLLEGGGEPVATVPERKPEEDSEAFPQVMASEELTQTSASTTDSRVIEGNPYWYLPNDIDKSEDAMSRTWTPEEEEGWRSGMAHPYTYQRFKTVREVVASKLRGSEAILWDALSQPKFWTRMHALIGLAEFNIPVSLQVVEETIGQERSELVADFFERFIKKSSAGQRYVMRQAVRLLDEKARVNILKAIDKGNDSFRDLYLVAATMDPGPKVQAFARRALARRPIPAGEFERLRTSITSGDLSGVLEGQEPASISDVAIEPTATGSELEIAPASAGEYDEYDEYGVEFYEEEETPEEDVDLGEYEVDENF